MNKEFLDPNTRYSDQKVDLAKMPGILNRLSTAITLGDAVFGDPNRGGGILEFNLELLPPPQSGPPFPLRKLTSVKTAEEIVNEYYDDPDKPAVIKIVGEPGEAQCVYLNIDTDQSNAYVLQYGTLINGFGLKGILINPFDRKLQIVTEAVTLNTNEDGYFEGIEPPFPTYLTFNAN